jgi:hypothetical protein
MHNPNQYAHDTPMLYTCLTRPVHSRQEPIEGSTRARKGVARGVAGVLVGSLCLLSTQTSEAQLVPTKYIKRLADKQLTNKQYKCHNEIIYRESSWNINARTGSHYGLYQGRSKYLKNAPADVQFWWFWYYTANRYGVTKYDEPNYCVSLAHLKRYGWQ